MNSSEKQKKVALFYPLFLGGGAEAVALWIAQALKDNYDLTLFTLVNIDVRYLNAMYGTEIEPEKLKINALIPDRLSKFTTFLVANNWNFKIFSYHLIIRKLKAHRSEYDLAISTYNAIDMGGKDIQYIHWVKVLDDNKIYNRVSKLSYENLKNNYSIANSGFVADKVKQTYGIESTVIYPPVVLEVQDIPWETKEYAFICSGRLTRPKEPHRVIEILKEVRAQGFDVKLYLTGGGGGTYAVDYRRFLQKMIDQNSDWVTLYENLPYEDYKKVLTRCKYGIHYKKEPFGISVAEMVKAGALTFARRKGGGQIEIIGPENDELLFDRPEEAVKQIVAVLSDEAKEKEMLAKLAARKELFSTAKFTQEIKKFVDHSLA